MGWSMQNLIAVALALAIIAVLLLLGRALLERKRRARAINAAETETRVHLKAIAAAIVSRNFDELATVPVRIAEICRIAAAHGADTSKLRLDHWRLRAKDMMSGDDTPNQRLPASRANSPFNILNPDEPGTPGIPINAPQAVPMDPADGAEGWTVGPVGQAVATLGQPYRGFDAIARVIEEEVMRSRPDGILLPERQMIEVLTVDEHGNARSSFEPDTDGPYIVIDLRLEEVSSLPEEARKMPPSPAETELSDDERFDRLFDRMIVK